MEKKEKNKIKLNYFSIIYEISEINIKNDVKIFKI